MNRKWVVLTILLGTGAFLWQNGCLSAFWQGMRTGFPAHNPWVNLAIDVASGVLLG